METGTNARAVADLAAGYVLATVELAASPARVFRALRSEEVVRWWVRPGVFDTREWTADVTPGGHWRTSGMGGGAPYALAGEYVAVEAPLRLVHTWSNPDAPGAPSTVEYILEPTDGGVRLTVRHAGLKSRPVCANTGAGWETSLARLAEILDEEAKR